MFSQLMRMVWVPASSDGVNIRVVLYMPSGAMKSRLPMYTPSMYMSISLLSTGVTGLHDDWSH